MEITKELNTEQALELFKDNSIMVEDRDVMPVDTAINILGAEAVSFARNIGVERNVYWLGENKSLQYLTKRGFGKAVTYKNIMLHIGNS